METLREQIETATDRLVAEAAPKTRLCLAPS